ncbi:MAG: hypothetical protein IJ308_04425 [Clostridia bacterium]|nr:hypothetical protein [Clostridia bacterium]
MFKGLAIACVFTAILFGILSFSDISNLSVATSAVISAIILFSLSTMQENIKDVESKIRILENSLSQTKEAMNDNTQSNRSRISDIEKQMNELKSTPPPPERITYPQEKERSPVPFSLPFTLVYSHLYKKFNVFTTFFTQMLDKLNFLAYTNNTK